MADSKKIIRPGIPVEDALFWPSGDINTDFLENILFDAELEKSKGTQKVVCYENRRVKKFDVDNPQYESLPRAISINQLKRLYKRINGRSYNSNPVINHEQYILFTLPKSNQLYTMDIGS